MAQGRQLEVRGDFSADGNRDRLRVGEAWSAWIVGRRLPPDGIDGALQRLQDQAYGTVALVAVAIGLIAFGVYSVVDARYRKI